MARFTPANAREMSARGNAARWSRYRMAKEAAGRLAATPVTISEPDYAALRLMRVRATLDILDARLARLLESGDAAGVDQLARAARALSEQECWLSGRPRPGVRKATAAESRYRPPIEPLPSLATLP